MRAVVLFSGAIVLSKKTSADDAAAFAEGSVGIQPDAAQRAKRTVRSAALVRHGTCGVSKQPVRTYSGPLLRLVRHEAHRKAKRQERPTAACGLPMH